MPTSKFSPAPQIRLARLFFTCALLALCLAPLGCAHMPRMLGGTGDLELRLDGEQTHEASLPVGRILSLDMRDPGLSGYVFTGTVFNTNMMRLDGIEPMDGGRRVRYTFAALAEGETEVAFKIRKPDPGYRPEVFKRVKVIITQ